MSLSLNGLFRGVVFLGIALVLLAIGIGRLAPPPAHVQTRVSTCCVGFDGYQLPPRDGRPRFLDPQNGKILHVQFPTEDYVDRAVCSPWKNEDGETEVVTRWARRAAQGQPYQDYGLARYRFPSGDVVERISMSILPETRVCFDPRKSGRILFAACGGELFSLTLGNPEETVRGGDLLDSKPHPLHWRLKIPGASQVVLDDLCWPNLRGFENRIVVSLQILQPNRSKNVYNDAQLWWLELDAGRTQVVAAGRLIAPEAGAPDNTDEERQPNLTTAPDGSLVMAFLAHRSGEKGWRMKLTPVTTDLNGALQAVRNLVYTIAEGGAPVLPVFSADGRWVYRYTEEDPAREQVERYSVADALAGRRTRPTTLALGAQRTSWWE
jgi:hypothetical protein